METFITFGAAFILLLMILYYLPLGLWFAARVSGVEISLLQLLLMRFRKTPPALIVRALIEARKGGVSVDAILLETHYLAGGNVANLVHGLVAAKAAGLSLSYKKAAAAELAGIDLLKSVKKKVEERQEDLEIFE